jgi:hypothetical protein
MEPAAFLAVHGLSVSEGIKKLRNGCNFGASTVKRTTEYTFVATKQPTPRLFNLLAEEGFLFTRYSTTSIIANLL